MGRVLKHDSYLLANPKSSGGKHKYKTRLHIAIEISLSEEEESTASSEKEEKEESPASSEKKEQEPSPMSSETDKSSAIVPEPSSSSGELSSVEVAEEEQGKCSGLDYVLESVVDLLGELKDGVDILINGMDSSYSRRVHGRLEPGCQRNIPIGLAVQKLKSRKGEIYTRKPHTPEPNGTTAEASPEEPQQQRSPVVDFIRRCVNRVISKIGYELVESETSEEGAKSSESSADSSETAQSSPDYQSSDCDYQSSDCGSSEEEESD